MHQIDAVHLATNAPVVADGSAIDALDTGGAWVLQKLLLRLTSEGASVTLHGLRPAFEPLLTVVAQQVADQAGQLVPAAPVPPNTLYRIAQSSAAAHPVQHLRRRI
ncbi:MAG: STAS domain-containing protein [Burkholderiaceae bacterium]|nr:STAS domain-containing protein [Burkholderiaceae bacterium]